MALSMDEQRVLAEIERRLAADDPGLATCLTSFRRPGPVTVLRSPRARIVGSLFTVLLVAMVSLMVYAMIPFRTHARSQTSNPGTPSTVAASASAGNALHPKTRPGSANASGGVNAQGSSTQAAGQVTPSSGP